MPYGIIDSYEVPSSLWAQWTYECWLNYVWAQSHELKEKHGSKLPVISCRPYGIFLP